MEKQETTPQEEAQKAEVARQLESIRLTHEVVAELDGGMREKWLEEAGIPGLAEELGKSSEEIKELMGIVPKKEAPKEPVLEKRRNVADYKAAKRKADLADLEAIDDFELDVDGDDADAAVGEAVDVVEEVPEQDVADNENDSVDDPVMEATEDEVGKYKTDSVEFEVDEDVVVENNEKGLTVAEDAGYIPISEMTEVELEKLRKNCGINVKSKYPPRVEPELEVADVEIVDYGDSEEEEKGTSEDLEDGEVVDAEFEVIEEKPATAKEVEDHKKDTGVSEAKISELRDRLVNFGYDEKDISALSPNEVVRALWVHNERIRKERERGVVEPEAGSEINAEFAKRFPNVVEIMKKERDDLKKHEFNVLRAFIRAQKGTVPGAQVSDFAVYAEARGFFRDNAGKEPPTIREYVAPTQPPVVETPPPVENAEENDGMDETVREWLDSEAGSDLSRILERTEGDNELRMEFLRGWLRTNLITCDVNEVIDFVKGEIKGIRDSEERREDRGGDGRGEDLKEAMDMREKLPDSRNSLWLKIYEITEQTLDAKGSGKLLSDESVFQKLGLLEGGIGGFLFPAKIMGGGGRELREDQYAREVAEIKAFVSARRKLHDSLQDIKNDLPYGDWLNKLKSAGASSSLVTFEVDGSRRIDDYQAFARAEFGEFTNPAKNEVMRLCIGVADLVRARFERERLLERGAVAGDPYMVGIAAREQEAERLMTSLGLNEDYIADIGGAGFNPAILKRAISTHRFVESGGERAVGETTTDLVWDFLEAHQWRIWTGDSPVHSAAYFGEWGDDKDIVVAKMLEQQGKRLGDVLPGIMKSGLENLNLEGRDGYELAKTGQFFSRLASNRPENKLVTSPMALSLTQALDGEGLRALFLMDLPGGKGILNQGENVGAWIGSKLKIDMLVGDGVYNKERAKEILLTALDFSTWLISWENKQYKEGTNLVTRAVKIREFVRELNGGGFLDGNLTDPEKREIISKAEARRGYLLKLAFTTGERSAAFKERGKGILTSSIKEPKESIDTKIIRKIVGESPYLKKYRKIRGTPKGDKYRDVLTRWGWWEDGFETD